MDIGLATSAGFLVGLYAPTQVLAVCLAPLAAIPVEVAAHLLLHQSLNWFYICSYSFFAVGSATGTYKFMND